MFKIMKQNQIILAILLFVFLLDIQSIFGDNGPGRPSVGVVLSGGGARGIAHIGVLRVLEKYQIPVDYIGGTSFGALIAAFYASGYDSYQIEKIIKNVNWETTLSAPQSRQQYYFYTRKSKEENLIKVRFKNWRLRIPSSISSSQKILNSLAFYFTRPNYISNGNFLKLKIPLFISATDIVSGKNKTFMRGDLIKVLQASLSAPFLFTPVEIDSDLYIDGGITNNLPISTMKEMGADIIIASNSTSFLYSRKYMNNPITVANQIINIMMFSKIEDELKQADIIIRPPLEEISNTEFTRWAELIDIGKAEAENNIDSLLSLVEPVQESVAVNENIKDSNIEQIILFGNKVFNTQELLSNLPSKISIEDTNKFKNIILEKYINNGYILANIDSISVKNKVAFLHINEGDIEKISLSGNELTKDFVILREISTELGDIFNINKIQSDIKRIYSTNYFDLVSFDVKKTQSKNVALTFVVKEKPFGIIEAGANYNTEESSSAFISAGHDNVFGTGNALNFYMRFGVERRFGFRLTTDRMGKTNLNNSLEFYLRDNTEIESDRDWNILTETGFFDDKRLGLMSLIFDYRVSNLRFNRRIGQKRTSGLGVRLVFDSFDRFPYPYKGLYRMASYTNFNEALGSEYNFQQFKLINGIHTKLYNGISVSNWIYLMVNSTNNGKIPYNRTIKRRPDNTFFGYHYGQIAGEDIFYISLQMRILLKKFSLGDPRQKLFLITKAGVGEFGTIDEMEEFWDIFKKGSKSGYAIGLEMPTIFGPVILMYENSKDNSFWNFSIGYNF